MGLKPTLLVLAEFSFQCANILDAMFEHHALCRQLLVHFPAQVVYVLSVWGSNEDEACKEHIYICICIYVYMHECARTNVFALVPDLVGLLVQVYA